MFAFKGELVPIEDFADRVIVIVYRDDIEGHAEALEELDCSFFGRVSTNADVSAQVAVAIKDDLQARAIAGDGHSVGDDNLEKPIELRADEFDTRGFKEGFAFLDGHTDKSVGNVVFSAQVSSL